MEAAQIVLREVAQIELLLCAVTHDAADRFVSISKGHTLANQDLGEIRGKQQRVTGASRMLSTFTLRVAMAPAITSSESRSVSAESKIGSLSSCRSRL